jgi:hypothetical protein
MWCNAVILKMSLGGAEAVMEGRADLQVEVVVEVNYYKHICCLYVCAVWMFGSSCLVTGALCLKHSPPDYVLHDIGGGCGQQGRCLKLQAPGGALQGF